MQHGPAANRTLRRLGVVVVGGAAAFALAACGSSEGTVVAKTDQAVDPSCQASGTVTPMAFPVWQACAAPECWRLVVRDNDGDTAEPCVSREEYDRTRLGAFWHGRTDG